MKRVKRETLRVTVQSSNNSAKLSSTVQEGDLSEAGNCTGLEKAPAWNKLLAGNSPCLELARSKMVSPRAWKTLFPGLHSRLEKQAGWKKALAGNDSWLEQGLCESKK